MAAGTRLLASQVRALYTTLSAQRVRHELSAITVPAEIDVSLRVLHTAVTQLETHLNNTFTNSRFVTTKTITFQSRAAGHRIIHELIDRANTENAILANACINWSANNAAHFSQGGCVHHGANNTHHTNNSQGSGCAQHGGNNAVHANNANNTNRTAQGGCSHYTNNAHWENRTANQAGNCQQPWTNHATNRATVNSNCPGGSVPTPW